MDLSRKGERAFSEAGGDRRAGEIFTQSWGQVGSEYLLRQEWLSVLDTEEAQICQPTSSDMSKEDRQEDDCACESVQLLLTTNTRDSLSFELFLPCHQMIIQSFAFTIRAQASVLYDLGRSIGNPYARSMMSCARTPSAREQAKSTV